MQRSLWLNKTAADLGLPGFFRERLAAGVRRVRAVEAPVTGQIRLPAQDGRSEREFDYALMGLPGRAGALPVAERVRTAVEDANGSLDRVTVSIGICALNAGHADYAALMHGVDTALYRSKAAGRNQGAA